MLKEPRTEGHDTNIVGNSETLTVLLHSTKSMKRSLSNTVNRTVQVNSWLNCSDFVKQTADPALTWFEVLGYTTLRQSDIISGRHQAILQNYRQGILGDRFRQSMQRINPTVSLQQIESILDHLTNN